MPSTPTAYETPNCEIHEWVSPVWNCGPAGVPLDPRHDGEGEVIREAPSAMGLAKAADAEWQQRDDEGCRHLKIETE